SLRCSRTRRTARSRTSGENLVAFLFMARFSQESEPPQNSVRFTYAKFVKGDADAARSRLRILDGIAPYGSIEWVYGKRVLQ
ncbi:hypothetical protein, partial [Burkholderia vietnamiensis]|uniref:hypothetical protein n=1 Tax=Burkholderia vietnamiensis TaxID=60552 RepID=UPI001B958649